MLAMAYRHGLRAAELCKLRWVQVSFADRLLSVERDKKGRASTHPIPGDELRALRALRREYPDAERVFVTERDGAPMTPSGLRKMMTRAAESAGFPFPVHPHMLRHGCGYKLVNDNQNIRAIQQYLGHRRIESTEIYTELAPNAFANFWTE
jgi:type 1 fimbriae regulatory protein FimB/type 1 fimbriae regulatory protein FimE